MLVVVQWLFSVLCTGCNKEHFKKNIIFCVHITFFSLCCSIEKDFRYSYARYKYHDPNRVPSYCCVILSYSLWSGECKQYSFCWNTVQQEVRKCKGTLMSCLTVSLVLIVMFPFHLQVTTFTVNSPKCGKEQRLRVLHPADEVQYCNPSLLFKYLILFSAAYSCFIALIKIMVKW